MVEHPKPQLIPLQGSLADKLEVTIRGPYAVNDPDPMPDDYLRTGAAHLRVTSKNSPHNDPIPFVAKVTQPKRFGDIPDIEYALPGCFHEIMDGRDLTHEETEFLFDCIDAYIAVAANDIYLDRS